MRHHSDQSRRLIDRLAAPDFVSGLEEAPLPTVLERVRICADLDLEYSYYRRLLQGRLDILTHEQARRAGGEDSDLRGALPDILARTGEPDRTIRFRRKHLVELLTDRLPAEVHPLVEALFPVEPPPRAPEWIPATGGRDVDRILTDDILPRITAVGDEELEHAVEDHRVVEQAISTTRRRILAVGDEVERVAIRRLKGPLDGPSVVHTVEWICDAYLRQLARTVSGGR